MNWEEMFPDADDLFYSDDEYWGEYLYVKEIESLFRIITAAHAQEKQDYVLINRLSGDARIFLESKGYDITDIEGIVKISWE